MTDILRHYEVKIEKINLYDYASDDERYGFNYRATITDIFTGNVYTKLGNTDSIALELCLDEYEQRVNHTEATGYKPSFKVGRARR